MKRVFLTVLDSVGAGEAPDSGRFGDAGANTLLSLSKSKYLNIPYLKKAGLGNIDGLDFFGKSDTPLAAFGKMQEKSNGKDTTTGHFEICGIISKEPLPTFPDGFPDEIIDKFKKACGRGVLCNRPYSGTEVIKDYGEKHLKSKDLIVYTSADSVFQIAAHTSVVPLELLYSYCEKAREMLVGKYGVGRVIARPFAGEVGAFYRLPDRRDYSIEPPSQTLLDKLKSEEKDVIAIGKIRDIFAGRGITEHIQTHENREGMKALLDIQNRDFDGICFTNLVDFDMVYGHRRDLDGYAKALSDFDAFLPDFVNNMRKDDLLIITADHGCDPCFTKTTDHTREYVPLLVFGCERKIDLKIRNTFSDIAASICEYLEINNNFPGKSFIGEI